MKSGEKIALQKWIDLFYTGFEVWSDWRRTGMPEIVPGPNAANGRKFPMRFQFPNDVKLINEAHYHATVSEQGSDYLNTNLWWNVD